MKERGMDGWMDEGSFHKYISPFPQKQGKQTVTHFTHPSHTHTLHLLLISLGTQSGRSDSHWVGTARFCFSGHSESVINFCTQTGTTYKFSPSYTSLYILFIYIIIFGLLYLCGSIKVFENICLVISLFHKMSLLYFKFSNY